MSYQPSQQPTESKPLDCFYRLTYMIALMMGSRKYCCCFIYEHKQTNPEEIAEIFQPCATILSIVGFKQNNTQVKIAIYNAKIWQNRCELVVV